MIVTHDHLPLKTLAYAKVFTHRGGWLHMFRRLILPPALVKMSAPAITSCKCTITRCNELLK
jgi:hypothetical protein